MVLANVMDRFQQHASRTACGIINGFPFPGIQDIHHQPHNRARGVKFAGLLVGGVCKLLDQVFVGLTEDIGLRRSVGEPDAGKVLD